jgi:RNA polymerase sigma-70 factor (ECF subfamily)
MRMTVAAMSPPTADTRLTAVEQERVFRELVVEHAAHLQRLLRSLGVPDADIDDVCQETFIVAHRRLDGFEGRSTLRTWLCGIALRVASDYRDKAYRRRERPSDKPPGLVYAAQQERTLEHKQACELLERLLSGLAREQREVFVLYEVVELSVPEVASALGCPVQTAYSRLHAAREHVAKRMALVRARDTERAK